MRFSLVLALFFCYCNCTKQRQNAVDIPELDYLNVNINPCDDFYEYTCGNFKNIHPLPEGELMWDHFTILQQEIHSLAKEILQSERTSHEPPALQKAKAFYTACKDVDYMEYLGTPQITFLQELGSWPAISANSEIEKLSWNEMAEITAEYGLPFLLGFAINPALFNATSNVIWIERDTLVTPEASGIRAELPIDITDYLFSLEEIVRTHKAKQSEEVLPYLEFLKSIAFRLRDVMYEPTSNDKIIGELQETIDYMRTVKADGVISANTTIPYLPPETSIKVLQNWTDISFGDGFLDWVSYLNIVLKPAEVRITENTNILVSNAKSLYGILNLYKVSNARQLKNYVMARLLTHMAPDSDRFMRDQWKTFTLVKNGKVYDREIYCVRKTLGYKGNIDFSLAVTYEYQKYHFNPNKLKKAATMVEDLQITFLEMLDHSLWMDAESKEKARAKAVKIITLLGYPEEAEEDSSLNEYYDNMRVCTWDHFGNAQRLRAFGHADSLKDIGDIKIRDAWNRSPLEVNAFYNRGNNRILFPVSVLNPVFFNGDYNVLDYGRMGAIIGHEITHGFDEEGSKYNADGILTGGLWSKATQNAFNERAECFKRQYSNYYIKEINSYVNGNLTFNENLADNGGLRTAYQAFQNLSTASQSVPDDTTFTPEQLFFIGFGTMWCTEETNEYLELMKKGYYAPGRYRVIGSVSNMEEFAEAFQCPKGSNMNPVDKCILW